MPKQKIEIEVDVPEGYEVDGFRVPKVGEFVLEQDTREHLSRVSEASNPLCCKNYLILRRVTLDRLKELIVELEGLMMSAEDLKIRAQKQFGELEHTDFAYHMATAINGVDDACDEVKKMVAQMEASE